MQAILEKLFEIFREWYALIIPWCILNDDQCGLVRRMGVYRRDLKHGWNWKWPIIEEPLTDLSAIETTTLREQTLTTSDDGQVTIRAVVTYQVVDPYKYIIGCGQGADVVNDVVCCVIAEIVPGLTKKAVLHDESFTKEMLRKVRAKGKRFGIDVDAVGLVDRVETHTYRLITSDNRDGAARVP